MRSVGDGLEADVVVVGAGLAGLSAAQTLEASGLRCLVIEAQGRAGGRVHSVSRPGGWFAEAGAQFFNVDMAQVSQLVARSGLTPVRTRQGGDDLLLKDPEGEAVRSSDLEFKLDWDRLLQERGANDGRGDESLAELIRSTGSSPDYRGINESIACELMGRDPGDLSAQGFIALATGYLSDRGDLELQADGPLRMAVERLADGIGDRLRYYTPVSAIRLDGCNAVVAEHRSGEVRAAGAVLAIPPPAAQAVMLPPRIREHIRPVLGSYLSGSIVKVTVIYREAFWRTRRLSGRVVSLEPRGIVAVDGSNRTDSIGRLVVFVGADLARRVAAADSAVRQAFAVDFLAGAFGKQAEEPLDVIDSVWVDDPWCGGGYNAYIRYGGLADAATRIRDSQGRIVFACSEIAERFPGYMEGAIDAGQAAAHRLMSVLACKV